MFWKKNRKKNQENFSWKNSLDWLKQYAPKGLEQAIFDHSMELQMRLAILKNEIKRKDKKLISLREINRSLNRKITELNKNVNQKK